VDERKDELRYSERVGRSNGEGGGESETDGHRIYVA